MTDEDALAILHERRGHDVRPAGRRRVLGLLQTDHAGRDETAAHPAAKAVGGARAGRAGARPQAAATPKPRRTARERAINEVLTISSLARAVSGNASMPTSARWRG